MSMRDQRHYGRRVSDRRIPAAGGWEDSAECPGADHPFGTPSKRSSDSRAADHNGGSACGYQRDLRDVGGPADPRSARHTAARPEYLCTEVLHGECSLMPPTGRPSHARSCGNHPRMRSRADVPEPGFEVEYEVPAAEITGCPQLLIVLAASAAVARAARWSSTVFRPAPMVLTDRCVAPASCHCRIAAARLS
jgi:hypothetical protein